MGIECHFGTDSTLTATDHRQDSWPIQHVWLDSTLRWSSLQELFGRRPAAEVNRTRSVRRASGFVLVADASMCRAGLESGTFAQADFRNGLETQKVCDAVLESARSGRWMEVAQ